MRLKVFFRNNKVDLSLVFGPAHTIAERYNTWDIKVHTRNLKLSLHTNISCEGLCH